MNDSEEHDTIDW